MKRFFTKKNIFIISTLVLFFLVFPLITRADMTDAVAKYIITAMNPLTALDKLLQIAVLPVAAAVMSLAGFLMDKAILFSLNTSYIFSNMSVINDMWSVIRDVINLLFIFSLIWISISIILSTNGFNAKSRLTQVIIAAIIVNFSLYFTKALIDVGNIFGNWLYSGILAAVQVNASSSISALIASKFNILDLWGGSNLVQNIANWADGITDPTQRFGNSVMKLITLMVATYIFMYTFILFLTRAVTIIFLLILSPIGFVGGLLPQLEEYSKKWWKELVDAITFPISFLLLLYISLQLIISFDKVKILVPGPTAIASLIFGIDTNTLFRYIIVISALAITLKVAKDSAGKLGGLASGIAGGTAKFFATATTRGFALAGRAGAAAYFADKGKGAAEAGKTFRSAIPILKNNKPISETIKKTVKEGSWDVTNIPLGGKSTLGSVVGGATGIDITAKSAKDIKEEKEKWDKEYKLEQNIEAILEDIRNIEKNKEIKRNNQIGSAAWIAANQAIDGSQTRIREKTSKMSNKDLEYASEKITNTASKIANNNEDPAVNNGVTTASVLESFSNQLKQNQINHIANSDMSGKIKSAIEKARQNELKDVLNQNQAQGPGLGAPAAQLLAIKKAFGKLSPAEVAKLDMDTLKNPAIVDLLKPDHLRKISEEYSPLERAELRGLILNKTVPANQTDKTQDWLKNHDAGSSF